MNQQYAVLDTITNWESIFSGQTLTNEEGKIILLNNGKVFCFDPSGDKQVKKSKICFKIKTFVKIFTYDYNLLRNKLSTLLSDHCKRPRHWTRNLVTP